MAMKRIQNMKLNPRLFLTLMFVVAVLPLHSQVTPAAVQGSTLPVVAGIGGSDFSLDWGPGNRMEGVTAWVDVYPNILPRKLNGLGIEVEGRDINFNRPSGFSKMRQDTGMGGLIYALPHYRNFRPYIKFLAGIGSIDFPVIGPKTYTHDTFLVTAPAGGMETRVWQHVWVRAEYEYQSWHQAFGPNDLNPNGVTAGLSYDFRPVRRE